jgi:hypothetical protein
MNSNKILMVKNLKNWPFTRPRQKWRDIRLWDVDANSTGWRLFLSPVGF